MRAALVLAISVSAAPCAVAQETLDLDVSGYAGVVSDYRWRGMSQTDNEGAAQADLSVEHPSGWHGDLWASAPTQNFGKLELDFTFGKAFDFADGSLDVSVIEYVYPDLDGADYATLAAAYERELGSWTARGRLEYAPPQRNLGQPSTYANFEAEKVFGDTGFALIAGIGWESGEFTLDGEKWDYALGGSYRIGPAAIALTYSGTDETAPVGAADVYTGRLSLGLNVGF
ncbi:MAG: TorF family putative porin [Hyphomonadaceae bacterium]